MSVGGVFRHWRGVLPLLLCLAGAGLAGAGLMVPAKAVAAQWLLERAFERSLVAHAPVRPWPWADMRSVARLRVPRLGVERIVLDGGSGQAMAFGPTLLPGAAEPGRPGTAVIAAHRDTHFRFLARLRRGDTIEFRGIDGPERRYAVIGAEVVRWDEYGTDAGRNGEALDLATCYPFGALGHGPLRYVVHATGIGLARAEAWQRTNAQ